MSKLLAASPANMHDMLWGLGIVLFLPDVLSVANQAGPAAHIPHTVHAVQCSAVHFAIRLVPCLAYRLDPHASLSEGALRLQPSSPLPWAWVRSALRASTATMLTSRRASRPSS
jgi:hypothetical protein